MHPAYLLRRHADAVAALNKFVRALPAAVPARYPGTGVLEDSRSGDTPLLSTSLVQKAAKTRKRKETRNDN